MKMRIVIEAADGTRRDLNAEWEREQHERSTLRYASGRRRPRLPPIGAVSIDGSHLCASTHQLVDIAEEHLPADTKRVIVEFLPQRRRRDA